MKTLEQVTAECEAIVKLLRDDPDNLMLQGAFKGLSWVLDDTLTVQSVSELVEVGPSF